MKIFKPIGCWSVARVNAFAALMAGLCITVFAGLANASTLYDNLNPSSGGSCVFGSDCGTNYGAPDDFAAQLFTLGTSATILSGAFTELDMYVDQTDGVYYAIYNNVGGLPSGAPLFSGESGVATTVLSIGGGYYTVNQAFDIDPATLAAGSYFIAIHASSYYFDYLQDGLVLSGAAESPDGGTTWYAGYEDAGGISVALYGDSISATPLPDTLPLFVSGLGVIGLFEWSRRRKAGVRMNGDPCCVYYLA